LEGWELIKASQSVYDGHFVEDNDFWFTKCLESKTINLCSLVRYRNTTEGLGGPKVEPVVEKGARKLSRWEVNNPHPACPFKYFTKNETLDLLHSMNVSKIHIIGDSMGRYFCFDLLGILTDTDREQHTFHFDFEALYPSEVGIMVMFRWHEAIADFPKSLSQHAEKETTCQGDDSIVIMGNNIHEVFDRPALFQGIDTKPRGDQIREVVDSARKECGKRIMWRGPNQLAQGKREVHHNDQTISYGEVVDFDEFKVLPALMEELQLPLLDAYRITDATPEDSVDGLHYNRWELEHEIHAFFSQADCLHRHGFW